MSSLLDLYPESVILDLIADLDFISSFTKDDTIGVNKKTIEHKDSNWAAFKRTFF